MWKRLGLRRRVVVLHPVRLGFGLAIGAVLGLLTLGFLFGLGWGLWSLLH